jgi:crotonobetainyl-CoA:carnitine CoA-transferase CaiB-like acyl-CoA transferase
MTGEADGPPVKVPIAVNDVMTGLNAAIAILAALRHRDRTSKGQHIDLALLDVQVGWLFNQGANYLVGGVVPKRLGTAHPNTVPYQAFETADGWIVCGANNDEQFKRFATVIGRPELGGDRRFITNAARLQHRTALVALVGDALRVSQAATGSTPSSTRACLAALSILWIRSLPTRRSKSAPCGSRWRTRWPRTGAST